MSITGMGASSSDIRTDYLTLLVAQLQNQNPLEPMDNDQMTAQLAQLSQLEQMENISNSFSVAMSDQHRTQAVELIGKEITFFIPNSTEPITGTVEKVDFTSGEPVLRVGEWDVPLTAVQTVSG